jgi:hypothetical protein
MCITRKKIHFSEWRLFNLPTQKKIFAKWLKIQECALSKLFFKTICQSKII